MRVEFLCKGRPDRHSVADQCDAHLPTWNHFEKDEQMGIASSDRMC